jgi:hypothetical protein
MTIPSWLLRRAGKRQCPAVPELASERETHLRVGVRASGLKIVPSLCSRRGAFAGILTPKRPGSGTKGKGAVGRSIADPPGDRFGNGLKMQENEESVDVETPTENLERTIRIAGRTSRRR